MGLSDSCVQLRRPVRVLEWYMVVVVCVQRWFGSSYPLVALARDGDCIAWTDAGSLIVRWEVVLGVGVGVACALACVVRILTTELIQYHLPPAETGV